MFIFALIILALSVPVFLVSRLRETSEYTAGNKKSVRAVGYFIVVVAIFFGFIASISTVATKNVGIVTAFNKPTGRTTGAGLKMHKPWEKIDEWDASRNTFDRLGKDKCLWVSVSGGKACIAVQIEWSAKAENAPLDWASYKETTIQGEDKSRFETFVARRVNPQMDAAITTAFTTFDPFGQINVATGALKAPDLNAEYKTKLEQTLNNNLGRSVVIDSIAFGTPSYDDGTTKAISAFSQKTLEKRNLEVDRKNATTRKEITEIDAKVDPVARCLSIAEKMNKEPGLCMTPTTATRSVN